MRWFFEVSVSIVCSIERHKFLGALASVNLLLYLELELHRPEIMLQKINIKFKYNSSCPQMMRSGMDCMDNEEATHFPQFSYSASGRE